MTTNEDRKLTAQQIEAVRASLETINNKLRSSLDSLAGSAAHVGRAFASLGKAIEAIGEEMTEETTDQEADDITAADGAAQCKLLRAAYKARGWNARAISVRNEEYSMGSSAHVLIKKPAIVDYAEAKRLAKACESVRYCTLTNEILSGGNRFLHFGYSSEAEKELAAPFLVAVGEAMARAFEVGPCDDLHEVRGTDYSIQYEDSQTWVVFTLTAKGNAESARTWDNGNGETVAQVLGRLENKNEK